MIGRFFRTERSYFHSHNTARELVAKLKGIYHFTLSEFMESRLVTPDSAAKRLLKFSAMAVVMAVGKKDVVWQYMITKPIQWNTPGRISLIISVN